uniref:Uncharacterized protein n=1 Tax=Amphimedon queenslandica TaxID=400682 RepID=A0A1X7VP80_AMPQE
IGMQPQTPTEKKGTLKNRRGGKGERREGEKEERGGGD